MQQPDLLPLFLQKLNALDLDYMVTGGVAAIAYGEPRVTHDVDLVIAFRRGDLERLSAAFPSPDFYAPPLETMRVEVARPRYGHFNLIHGPSGFKADVYPLTKDRLHTWAFGRRSRQELMGEPVWVAPPEYVILRKLEFYRDGGSDKHLRDIRAMLRISEGKIDLAEIATQSGGCGLTREWEKALSTEY